MQLTPSPEQNTTLLLISILNFLDCSKARAPSNFQANQESITRVNQLIKQIDGDVNIMLTNVW